MFSIDLHYYIRDVSLGKEFDPRSIAQLRNAEDLDHILRKHFAKIIHKNVFVKYFLHTYKYFDNTLIT